MREFKVGDRVRLTGHSWPVKRLLGKPALGDVVVLTGITDNGIPVFTYSLVLYCIMPADGYGAEHADSYDATPIPETVKGVASERDISQLQESLSTPESPNHYSRLKALTGVETWDILDFVAGDDPDMWNLGKYWFRMGHKAGQDTLTEKKKMLKYLERSIKKETDD